MGFEAFRPPSQSTPTMINRLAHLCFKTDQLDRMILFYRDILGLPVKFTLKNRQGFAFGYYFACGGRTFLELFDQQGAVQQWGGEMVKLPSPATGACYQHFCLEVENLDAFRADLIARGVATTPITIGMEGSRQCWIKDPDGNSIELMEYTPDSLQTKEG
jgi:lactoylglutathione lyase